MRAALPILLAVLIAGVAALYFYTTPHAADSTPQGALISFFFGTTTPSTPVPAQPQEALKPQSNVPTTAPKTQLPPAYSTLGQRSYYKDDEFGYFFEIPKGLTTYDIARSSTSTQIALANGANTAVVLITILPADASDTNLTAADIQAAAPQVVVANSSPINFAPNCGGTAFNSNSSNFSGASREIWFFCKGNLYQISASRADSALLTALAGTWTFR